MIIIYYYLSLYYNLKIFNKIYLLNTIDINVVLKDIIKIVIFIIKYILYL